MLAAPRNVPETILLGTYERVGVKEDAGDTGVLGCRIKQTATVVGDGVRRAAADVNTRFDVSGKAIKAAQG